MTFVLVHGAYHGSWCWELVIPALRRLGHRVTTVDLPIGDPNAGISDHAAFVADAADGSDDLILVGHSMAGLVLPAVPSRCPVRKMVFLCALLPRLGMSMNQVRAAEPVESYQPNTSEFNDLGEGVWMIGPKTATEFFFHDVPAELTAWALKRLRPQAYPLFDEVTPLIEWPEVESAFVLCRDDHALNPDWARSVAIEQLHVQPIELDGGHSPFLTRPSELADALNRIAQ